MRVGSSRQDYRSYKKTLPGWLSGKESSYQCRRCRKREFNPSIGRSPRGGHGKPLQYSCLRNPRDTGAQWAIVNGATRSQMWLNDWAHTHAREGRETRAFCLPHYVKILQEGDCLPGRRPSPRNQPSSTLILGFSASIQYETKYLLFKSDSLWYFVISSLIRLRQKNKSVENVFNHQMCKTEIQNLDLTESISFKNGLNATNAIINAPNLTFDGKSAIYIFYQNSHVFKDTNMLYYKWHRYPCVESCISYISVHQILLGLSWLRFDRSIRNCVQNCLKKPTVPTISWIKSMWAWLHNYVA